MGNGHLVTRTHLSDQKSRLTAELQRNYLNTQYKAAYFAVWISLSIHEDISVYIDITLVPATRLLSFTSTAALQHKPGNGTL